MDLEGLMDLALQKGKDLLRDAQKQKKEPKKSEPKKSYPPSPEPEDKEFVGPRQMVVDDVIKFIIDNPNIATYSPKKKKVVSFVGFHDYKTNEDLRRGMTQTLTKLFASKAFNALSSDDQAKVLAVLSKETTFGGDTEPTYKVKVDKDGKPLRDKSGSPVFEIDPKTGKKIQSGSVPSSNNPFKISTAVRESKGLTKDQMDDPEVYLPIVLEELGSAEPASPTASKEQLEEDAWSSYVVYNKGGLDKGKVKSRADIRKRAVQALKEDSEKSRKLLLNEPQLRKLYPTLKEITDFNKRAQGKSTK